MKSGLRWNALLALACILLLGGFKQPAPGGGGGGHHGGWIDEKFERALDEIEVTDEQRQQIDAVRDRLKTRLQQQKQAGDRQQGQQQMQQFWTSENPDPQQLRALVDQRLDRQRDRGYAMVDAAVEIHRILDAEQRSELAQLIGEKAEKKRQKKQQKKGQQNGKGSQQSGSGGQQQPRAR